MNSLSTNFEVSIFTCSKDRKDGTDLEIGWFGVVRG